MNRHIARIVPLFVIGWLWTTLEHTDNKINNNNKIVGVMVQAFRVGLNPSVNSDSWCHRDGILFYETRRNCNDCIQQKRQVSHCGRLLHAFSSDEYSTEEDELSDEELEASVGPWDDKIARFNTIQLTGRVGNTPEARYFDDGKVVVNLSLASRRKYHGMERKLDSIKMGEEETDWYGLEIWGPTAEFVAKYVDKGARVGVVGQLQIDTWNDKATGEARNRAKVIVRDFDILETRAEADLRRTGARGGPSFGMDEDDDESYSNAGSGGFFNNNGR